MANARSTFSITSRITYFIFLVIYCDFFRDPLFSTFYTRIWRVFFTSFTRIVTFFTEIILFIRIVSDITFLLTLFVLQIIINLTYFTFLQFLTYFTTFFAFLTFFSNLKSSKTTVKIRLRTDIIFTIYTTVRFILSNITNTVTTL